GHVRASSVARHHDGRRAGGDPHADGPHFDARRVEPGLHLHRARQGPAREHGRLQACAAQRNDPDLDRCRLTVRGAAGRRDCDRTIFLLAWHRPSDDPGHRQPGLLPRAGVHSGDRVDLCGCEPADGRSVFRGESEDTAISMSTAAISLPRLARHNPLAALGVFLIACFVIFALFAPWISPYDPAQLDLPSRLQPPTHQHLAGTDELGRDVLSRLIWGARISMFVGVSVVACSLFLGLIVGSIAGYYGGGIDRFVNVVLMNAFLSFPGILIAIAFVAFRGPGITNLVLALSLGGWVGYARLVRAQVLAVREREF